ncbi:MAG: hypothetical protein Q9187_007050, partial [Circinaria calcarea]
IYKALCPSAPNLRPRYGSLRTLYDPGASPSNSQVLDSGALVLYFPAPRTATGEEVLELQIHGGPAVVKAVLAAIPKAVQLFRSNTDVRYAEPGEFTRRAFYNNRLDLNQIEALGDTLSAETEQQRRLAVRGANSALTARYEAWRQQLLYARGELEALIDFSEDQHFEESPAKLIFSVVNQVGQLRGKIETTIQNSSRGELLRNGINIALLGAPNAGKSSLLNRIVGREAAIVSKEAGTTRDVVEVNLDIGGFLCRFGDLAGLRENSANQGVSNRPTDGTPIGEIEEEGIRRAKARVVAADVVVVVLSIEPGVTDPGRLVVPVNPEILQTLIRCDLDKQRILCVVNKSDLIGGENNIQPPDLSTLLSLMEPAKSLSGLQLSPLFISCKEQGLSTRNFSDGGIQRFLDQLIVTFKSMTNAVDTESLTSSHQQPWEESLGASERQRLLLVQCRRYLDDFLNAVKSAGLGEQYIDVDIVLAAESLRAAGDTLAKITGKGEAGDIEEVLGVVFEK